MRTLEQFFEELDEDLDVSEFEDPKLALAKQILTDYTEITGIELPSLEFFEEDPVWHRDDRIVHYTCPYWKVLNDPLIEKLMPTLSLVITLEINESRVSRVELDLRHWSNHIISGMLEYANIDGKLTVARINGKYVDR